MLNLRSAQRSHCLHINSAQCKERTLIHISLYTRWWTVIQWKYIFSLKLTVFKSSSVKIHFNSGCFLNGQWYKNGGNYIASFCIILIINILVKNCILIALSSFFELWCVTSSRQDILTTTLWHHLLTHKTIYKNDVTMYWREMELGKNWSHSKKLCWTCWMPSILRFIFGYI